MAGIELPRRLPAGGGGRRAAQAPTAADVQRVGIQRDPGVTAPAGAFGGQTGEALTQAGQGLTDFGGTLADVSARAKAVKRRAEVASAASDASLELQSWTLDRDKDPDYETYGERFEQKAEEVFEKYGQGLDEVGRQEFETAFKRISNEEAFRVRRLTNARTADAIIADLDNSLDRFARVASNAATPAEYDMTLAMVQESVERAVSDGAITAEEGERRTRVFRENLDEIQAMQTISENPAQAAEDLQDPDIYPHLDEKRRLTLLKEARTQVRIEENRRERERKEQQAILRGRVSSALKDELESIRRTGATQGLVTEGQIRAAYDPDTADEILGELEAEREFYNTRQEIALSPLSEDLAILEENAPSGEGFAVEAERQDVLQRAILEKRKALASDPAGYIFQASPAIAQEVQDAETPEAMRGAIDTMLAEQERLGIPSYGQRALSVGQAKQMTAQYAGQGDAQGRADWIRAQAEAYGEHWPRVYSEMGEAGLPGGAMVLAGMTAPGQTRAAVALAEAQQAGSKALKDAIGKEAAGEVEEAARLALADFDANMAATPGGGQVSNLYRDNVALLAMDYVRSGASPSEAAERAAADVVNDQYTFHGTYRVPAEHDGAEVEKRVSFFRTSRLGTLDIAVPPSLDERLADDDRRSQYLSALADKGYWITNREETGLLLMNEQGETVQLENGDPVEILFREIGSLPDPSTPPGIMEGASP